MIGLIMVGCLSLQACVDEEGNSLSLRDITDPDMKVMARKMRYVEIDGNCYSVVKYHTRDYDIAVHSYIPCDRVPTTKEK